MPSELISAFLWAQIENMDMIQTRRKEIWQRYYQGLACLADKGLLTLPDMPEYATNNAHMFYIVCRSLEERTRLIKHLKDHEILSVFHYLSLHKSGFYTSHPESRPENCQELTTIDEECAVLGLDLVNCDRFADCLLRLPLFYELQDDDVDKILAEINRFYEG